MTSWIRYLVIVLELLTAVFALGGGFYGMNGAKNVPAEWLEGTPFHSYFVPSLVLFVAVGLGMLAAAVVMIARLPVAPTVSLLAGLVLVVWIVAQVPMIGYVSWLQPAMFVIGLLIAALAAFPLRG